MGKPHLKVMLILEEERHDWIRDLSRQEHRRLHQDIEVSVVVNRAIRALRSQVASENHWPAFHMHLASLFELSDNLGALSGLVALRLRSDRTGFVGYLGR